ncbi:DUF3536 domain-containing protein [Candidatus Micrarchaeota archaeon]|nr:DUF3536 domain-containing protein [Candidatus Micrarchaeota archaeon]
MNQHVCIHGHFYQPPRENPWLEEVEIQEAAYPFHDWNDRITEECYKPNLTARVIDEHGLITDLINNFSTISFNVGPTLLSWMERHKPNTYAAIIEADENSMKKFSGHGAAMAQVYNHMIMPLAHPRDKITQVRWGIQDFKKRFRRDPEGMWLPETAVDTETLEVLAQHGIRFTVLDPRQAKKVRRINGRRWVDVSDSRIAPQYPYLCHLPSGKTITLFFYDKPISQDIAFGGLLKNGERFAHRILEGFSPKDKPQLVHVATDGETYGHHQKKGEMALGYGLHYLESRELAKITIYAEFLERYPPEHEVTIAERSAWSCAHGVDRWWKDCGCNSGSRPGWHQRWREPLRNALDWLRTHLMGIYEREAAAYVKDPWQTRDDYISVVLDRSAENVEAFFTAHGIRPLSDDEKQRLLKLLEMSRHGMLMYTSCGWFFDEISGIETVQVIQYAARASQLAQEVSGEDLESTFVRLLEKAPSNVSEVGHGANVFHRFVKPASLDLVKVAAHFALSSIFDNTRNRAFNMYCYQVEEKANEITESGKHRLSVGQLRISSRITRETQHVSYGVLWLGDHNLFGGVRPYRNEKDFTQLKQELREQFEKAEVPQLAHLIEKHFEAGRYSLRDLFRDEQRKTIDYILDSSVKNALVLYKKIFEDHYTLIRYVNDLGIHRLGPLQIAAEEVFQNELIQGLKAPDLDWNALEKTALEINRFSILTDWQPVRMEAEARLNNETARWAEDPLQVSRIETLLRLSVLYAHLPIEPDWRELQNQVFIIGKKYFEPKEKASKKGGVHAQQWANAFAQLSRQVGVKF